MFCIYDANCISSHGADFITNMAVLLSCQRPKSIKKRQRDSARSASAIARSLKRRMGSIKFFWRSGNSLRRSGFVTYVEVDVENEHILIERLRARDEAAFTELVERYYSYLLPLADFFVSN